MCFFHIWIVSSDGKQMTCSACGQVRDLVDTPDTDNKKKED